MFTSSTRREFMHTLGGAALLGLGNLSFLARLRPVSAEEARIDPELVRFRPEIEPTVRLLEESPRERLLEEVAARIRRGLSYQELLAALMLAGVRNVMPRPHVGYKFHAVLVVNSAHLASLAAPDAERWLPIFWSLDYFKYAQAANVREGYGRMKPVDEARVPPPRKVRQAFIAAMEQWDEEAADASAAGIARALPSHEAFELFCRYGARDFRSIGHKAIFVANSWRTLHCIGWQHAEPVLRSLAYALLNREGDNPLRDDAPADRPWRRNTELVGTIRADWRDGKRDEQGSAEMLAALRSGSDADAPARVVELLNRGVHPQCIWDGIFLGAGELLIRQPGIVALHAITTSNAMRYAYEATANDETRRLLLLQNAAFLPLFRGAMGRRGRVAEFRIDALEPEPLQAEGPRAAAEILAEVSRDRAAAARKTLSYLKDHPTPRELIDAARLLIFFKGNDSHDYKFSSAVLEDYYHVSPEVRGRFLAASMYQLRGAGDRDNKLIQRAREALKGSERLR